MALLDQKNKNLFSRVNFLQFLVNKTLDSDPQLENMLDLDSDPH